MVTFYDKKLKIRLEQEDDVDIIRKLTTAAFEGMLFSNQTEAGIIDALRNKGDLFLSLVAIDKEKIVGHISFSQVWIDSQQKGWYGLAPVSVWPEHQRKGIGKALIQEGLLRLKSLGAKGCVVLGEPDYYSRFGFVCDPGLRFAGVPPEYFQRLSFVSPVPRGEVRFHSAFG